MKWAHIQSGKMGSPFHKKREVNAARLFYSTTRCTAFVDSFSIGSLFAISYLKSRARYFVPLGNWAIHLSFLSRRRQFNSPKKWRPGSGSGRRTWKSARKSVKESRRNDTHSQPARHLFDCRLQNTNIVFTHTGGIFHVFLLSARRIWKRT